MNRVVQRLAQSRIFQGNQWSVFCHKAENCEIDRNHPDCTWNVDQWIESERIRVLIHFRHDQPIVIEPVHHQQEDAGTRKERAITPVSYTHLTLPTIYSV